MGPALTSCDDPRGFCWEPLPEATQSEPGPGTAEGGYLPSVGLSERKRELAGVIGLRPGQSRLQVCGLDALALSVVGAAVTPFIGGSTMWCPFLAVQVCQVCDSTAATVTGCSMPTALMAKLRGELTGGAEMTT